MRGFAIKSRLHDIGPVGRFGSGLLEQVSGIGKPAGRLARLGELEGCRLAIVAYGDDLIGRHGRGGVAQRDHDLGGRLGLNLPAQPVRQSPA